jgi:hypothetical protein
MEDGTVGQNFESGPPIGPSQPNLVHQFQREDLNVIYY